MASIQLLDQNTINQIAAGEVVERPASVIKELVENAIDAGASSVTVEVKDGGLKLIRVTDNGSGIVKDEIRTAFLRHSTSKIRQAQDLIDIHSLGFRGEALASIAAVSIVELITKTEDSVTGSRYIIEGGEEKTLEEIGAPTGTSFIVKDLFFNTPARLNFMKTPSTELGYVSDLINKMSMGNPSVAFKFISNGQVKLHTVGKGNLKDCVYAVFGKEVARNLLDIDYANETMRIVGFAGKPHISRGNRSYENYYLNGRYIKSRVVEKAVEDAFKAKLMLHRYPFVAFHLELLSKDVDVNVHPTKMEVRFMKEEDVYRLVFEGINKALSAEELIPEVKLDKDKKQEQKEPVKKENIFEPFEVRGPSYKTKDFNDISSKPKEVYQSNEKATTSKRIDLMNITSKDYLSATGYRESTGETIIPPKGTKPVTGTVDGIGSSVEDAKPAISHMVKDMSSFYSGDQVEMDNNHFIDSSAVKSHKIVGQLFDTYWVVELEDKYYLIDQHAAHEKVLYERLLKKLETNEVFGQRLLRPVVVDVSMQEMARFESHSKVFDGLGFEAEKFGEDSVIIRSVPFIFDKIMDVNQFVQILDGLEGSYSDSMYDTILDDLATMACKAAVKGNDRLSKAEYIQLIDDLLTLENPFHCPHGRPTIVAMTRYELEKKFKRN